MDRWLLQHDLLRRFRAIEMVPILTRGCLFHVHTTTLRSSHALSDCKDIGLGHMPNCGGDLFVHLPERWVVEVPCRSSTAVLSRFSSSSTGRTAHALNTSGVPVSVSPVRCSTPSARTVAPPDVCSCSFRCDELDGHGHLHQWPPKPSSTVFLFIRS